MSSVKTIRRKKREHIKNGHRVSDTFLLDLHFIRTYWYSFMFKIKIKYLPLKRGKDCDNERCYHQVTAGTKGNVNHCISKLNCCWSENNMHLKDKGHILEWIIIHQLLTSKCTLYSKVTVKPKMHIKDNANNLKDQVITPGSVESGQNLLPGKNLCWSAWLFQAKLNPLELSRC